MTSPLENSEAAETAALMARLNEIGDRLAMPDVAAMERDSLEAEAATLGSRIEELERLGKQRTDATEAEAPYQTGWRRVGALFLDGAVFAPLGWLDDAVWRNATGAFGVMTWAGVYGLACLAYPIVLVALYGQTLGKMACGVRVVDLSGGAVSRLQATLREIVPVLMLPVGLLLQSQNVLGGHLENHGFTPGQLKAVSLVLGGWVLLEVITMLTNTKRRAVHDFIAGTVVMRVKPVKPLLFALSVLLVIGLTIDFARKG